MKSSFHLTTQQLSWPLLILLILFLLLIVLAWPDPASGQASVPTVTATIPQLTPTALPGFYYDSADQTTGIIFGAVVLVLIIVIGTIGVMRRKNSNTH